MIKLIATDMDGTFLDDNRSYDSKVLTSLLDGLESQGMLFTVASGRALLALEDLFKDVVDRIAIIAENGGLVQVKGKVLFEALMSQDIYVSIAEQLRQFSDIGGMLLSGRHGSYAPLDADEDYLAHMRLYYANVQTRDWAQVDDDIFKVTVKFTGDTVREREAWITENIPGVKAVTTGFDSVDIILEEVDKGFGLDHLCQELKISLAETLAFGDNINDYEMLQVAGRAIAVENARPEIKKIAHEVIGHHKDQAVLTYMKGLVS